MSHNIQYRDYPENVDKDKVFSELSIYVQNECWQEGGHLNPIRWVPAPVCESIDAAQQYIETHDRGWYDCLAVRYREPIRGKESKAYLDLVKRRAKAADRYNKMYRELYAATVTAAFIGCKSCGSKLSREHLLTRTRSNQCPLCGADLRPASTLEKIQKARDSMEEINKKMEQEACRMAKTNGTVRWLVKIEFHT
ncbi:hypothetical protein [Candidatus Allofournierella merdipullorum]|uniref:hypothetical protein n=1 Tax=Candidatus Allofournierella merdipullorum TaxID=2838595 RepID=UPI00374E860F